MARKRTLAVKAAKTTGKAAGAVAGKVGSAAGSALKQAPTPSPNPLTNLIIADVVLRGGGQLLRHAVERAVLGAKYTPEKAKRIVKGRSMAQTVLGTAAARMATRSIPGAILVGGGLLAKALFDRRHSGEAKAEGDKAVERQIRRGK